MQFASLSIPGATAVPQESLRLLDDSQEWSPFSRPAGSGATCWESSVVIEGMHCAACALTLERALLAVAGVAMLSSALTALLAMSAAEVNR